TGRTHQARRRCNHRSSQSTLRIGPATNHPKRVNTLDYRARCRALGTVKLSREARRNGARARLAMDHRGADGPADAVEENRAFSSSRMTALRSLALPHS